MKVWRVRLKEVGSDSILEPSLYGDFDRDYVIRWFGLDQPDVEWYELTEEEI
jgi:hypothetical protein